MDPKFVTLGTLLLLAGVLAIFLTGQHAEPQPTAPESPIRTGSNPREPSDRAVTKTSAKRGQRPAPGSPPSKGWMLARGIEQKSPDSIFVTEATHRLVEDARSGSEFEEWKIRGWVDDDGLGSLVEINTKEGIAALFVVLHEKTGDEVFAAADHKLTINLLASENKKYAPADLVTTSDPTKRFPFLFDLTVSKR